MLDQQISQRFLCAMDGVQHGHLDVTMPDGKSYSFTGPEEGATAQITIHDKRLIPALLQNGDIALAEAYRDGWWDSEDLTQLFLFGLQNQGGAINPYVFGSRLGRLATNIAYLFRKNTVKGSQKNIHAHYDLGNEFYSLWLDPSMTYSSALFQNANENLQDAQMRKYDRILDRVGNSGNLLEIGCGWGGFAERAMDKGDFAVKGLTISKAQGEYAQTRLGQKASIALEDYRHQTGKYDQIVSIEMFEAVGEEFWPVYFSKIKSLLAKNGKAVIQSITIADNSFERYRKRGDPIRSFIFPGGMLPSPSRFRMESEKQGLRIADQFEFGQDYALTLVHWLDNFNAKIPQIKTMGFDDKFIRLWRFYLTSCIAAFTNGKTNVMQWELHHAA